VGGPALRPTSGGAGLALPIGDQVAVAVGFVAIGQLDDAEKSWSRLPERRLSIRRVYSSR
jgi:hypothetical protein